MNHLSAIAIKELEKGKPTRYRLFPIIIGFRCEGYELQKECRGLFIDRWKPVCGEHGKPIRCVQSDEKKLIEVAAELEQMAKHLSTIKVIEFNGT